MIWNNEEEARKHIKELVGDYYRQFKEKKFPLKKEIASIMHLGYLMKRKCSH